MTRRPARKKDTLTSLKRELKVLTINYDRLEVDRDEWRRSNKTRGDKLTKVEERYEKLSDQFGKASLENAELKGFIKRVEIEDRTKFLVDTGRKPVRKYRPNSDDHVVEYEMPPRSGLL